WRSTHIVFSWCFFTDALAFRWDAHIETIGAHRDFHALWGQDCRLDPVPAWFGEGDARLALCVCENCGEAFGFDLLEPIGGGVNRQDPGLWLWSGALAFGGGRWGVFLVAGVVDDFDVKGLAEFRGRRQRTQAGCVMGSQGQQREERSFFESVVDPEDFVVRAQLILATTDAREGVVDEDAPVGAFRDALLIRPEASQEVVVKRRAVPLCVERLSGDAHSVNGGSSRSGARRRMLMVVGPVAGARLDIRGCLHVVAFGPDRTLEQGFALALDPHVDLCRGGLGDRYGEEQTCDGQCRDEGARPHAPVREDPR